MSNINLNLRMNIESKLWKGVEKISKELVIEAVNWCALRYKFSVEEALMELNLEEIKVMRKEGKKKVEKKEVKKAEFPLPYNGECNEDCCQALRQNNGLYTQCQGIRRGSTEFCKSCASLMQKAGSDVPEYGTIKMRTAVGIFEYVDPKGRKPVAYTKVMNKYKLTKEQVLEEAKKMNMEINEEHFVVPEETKRGRPSKEKEPKEKGTRGRPKKSKKVLEIDNECEDLFASLVANANEVDDVKSEEEVVIKKNDVSEEEKEAKKAAEKAEKEAKKAAEKEAKKAAEKAEKEAKLAAEKAEKEAKLAAEKAEKEAKKAAEKAEKEAKKKAEEEEKAAKKLAAEQAKAEKEAAKASKAAAKAEKTAAKASKEAAKPSATEEEEEPDVVKKIEFEGKKYLKSKKSGIIYDYNEYTKNGEQVVVGKWNDTSNKIEFTASEEEEDEEDYEM